MSITLHTTISFKNKWNITICHDGRYTNYATINKTVAQWFFFNVLDLLLGWATNFGFNGNLSQIWIRSVPFKSFLYSHKRNFPNFKAPMLNKSIAIKSRVIWNANKQLLCVFVIFFFVENAEISLRKKDTQPRTIMNL